MKAEANLQLLTITIDMSRDRDFEDGYVGNHRPITDTERWDRDQCVVKPVKELHGLKDLFVHLAYPESTLDGTAVRELRERFLEQSVMGKDYDSNGRGKCLKDFQGDAE